MEYARKKPSDFTRNRVMPFEMIVNFLLNIVHENLQTAGRRFFDMCGIVRRIKEQSLSEARNKLKWEAFEMLFKITAETSFEDNVETWLGYQIFAIDGTKIELPHYPKVEEYWGEEKGSPLARGSILYDVVNDVVADAKISPLSTDERTFAKQHIEALLALKLPYKPFPIHDRGLCL